jgi:cation diffusion facilitator family transporter
MTNLLIKWFIPNYGETASPKVREAYGHLGSGVGILLNLFLCLTKMTVGLLFNSISILADGINNLSDAGSSIVTFIGFKLASKPADKNHPFGHARMEYLAGLIVSFIILFLGIELVRSSFDKILNPEPLMLSGVMVFILILSILLKLWLARFNHILGTRIQSATLKATATDSRNDVIATSAILIALLLSPFISLPLDGYMGVLVGCFIFYSAIGILKETSSPLLGQSPSEEFTQMIEEKIRSYPYVLGLHDLVMHSYGPDNWFVTVHVEVPANEDILISHDIIDNIERDFMKDLNIHLVIHLDPIVTDDATVNHLRDFVQQLVTDIHDDLSIHDFRVVQGTTHHNLIFDISVPIDCPLTNEKIAQDVTEQIQALNPDFYCILTIDRSYISSAYMS